MGSIDEIKAKLDIVDVVSEYATLHKSGRNFKALCPFHTEKTPSFFVFPERQSWHCFGSCGTGGDIFSFVMKKEGLDFSGALKLLAERAGVTLAPRHQEQARDEEAERLHTINQAAAEYYHNLLANDKAAEGMRRYLIERGVSAETIEGFQLGFSPESWDALYRHLTELGYKGDDLVKAGVASAKEGGGFRDQFRNRLMIPIRNEGGRAVGFGGRTIDGSNPKYLNSPQTAVFDKSGLLYALDRAKDEIKEQDLAIIVEGYLDVLTAHQAGMANVVAPMGTSLTPKHIALLKRFSKNLTLALDADAAGEQATIRGLEVARNALSERVDSRQRGWLEGDSKLQGKLRVILLPQGKDPDDMIREDPDEWRRLVTEASPLMDYFLKAATSSYDMSGEEGRTAAMSKLLPIVSEIGDSVERELYLKRLSQLVGVDEKTLAGKLAQLKPAGRERSQKAAPLPTTPISSHPLEEYCLALFLQHPELRGQGTTLPADYFEGTANREVFTAWHNNPDGAIMRQGLDPHLHEHLDSLLSKELPPASVRELETALADCNRRLAEQRLRRMKTMEQMLLTEAESEGNKERVQELLKGSLGPSTQLRDLFERARRERKGARQ